MAATIEEVDRTCAQFWGAYTVQPCPVWLPGLGRVYRAEPELVSVWIDEWAQINRRAWAALASDDAVAEARRRRWRWFHAFGPAQTPYAPRWAPVDVDAPRVPIRQPAADRRVARRRQLQRTRARVLAP
jgi:hypothetical protein